jgi:hypothetical protein
MAMGTDVRTMFDKEFLYSFDLQGRDVTVTIERVKAGTLTGIGGKKNKKPVVYFRGKEKGLGLNITNARTIAAMYGGFEIEKWIGRKITLYPTTTDFGGKTCECIRIRPKIPGSSAVDAPPDPREPGDDDEDVINRANAAPQPGELP